MQSAIETLRAISPDVRMAAVIGGDGEIESFSGSAEDMQEVVGPTGTTLSTLAERTAQVLGAGGLEAVVLAGTQGHVVAQELGGGRILIATASLDAKLGLLMDDVRSCAHEVRNG